MIYISESMMKTSQASTAREYCAVHLRSKHRTCFMHFTKW